MTIGKGLTCDVGVFIPLHSVEVVESAEAAGWGEAEAVEDHRLSLVWFGDATEGDSPFGAIAMWAGAEHHVTTFQVRQLFDDGSRRVSQAGTAHPARQCLPERHRPGSRPGCGPSRGLPGDARSDGWRVRLS